MSSAWQQRYIALERLLLTHAGLWQPVPFHNPIPPWAKTHPELYNALLALSDEETKVLEQNATNLQCWLEQYLPELSALPDLIALPMHEGRLPKPWPTGFEWDIPGRKWGQIEAFTAVLKPRAHRLVDWCAGKGHLSRSLAFQHDAEVHSLEWDAALCESANALIQKTHTRVTTILQDVLAQDASRHINEHCHCIALHACGKLHLQLMQTAAQKNAAALTFSPCCYHLIDNAVYSPLATLDKDTLAQRLYLSRELLRLAVQETITANGHAQRLRERKSAWRLGFAELTDNLQFSTPIRLPSLADRYFHGCFKDFCQQAALQVGVILPAIIDWAAWETQGWQAHARLQRLELLRHGFRRALECWLCLDRACWLEQQGYSVNMTTFCNQKLTPRNILIDAVLTHA